MTGSELAESYDPLGAHLADPHPFYAEARRSEPVFFSARLDAWVVTRFDDVDAILKDPEVFSSAHSLRPVRQLYPATFAAFAEGYPPKPDHITSDGEAHRRLRAPYTKRLSPAAVKALEPSIRKRAEGLVESFAGEGGADLVARYTSPLPVDTTADLFGIAPADVATAKSGSESLFQLGSADLTEADEAAAAREFVAFQHLMAGYVRRRHADPEDDLVSDVVAALAPDPEPLTFDQEAELVGTICSTIGAGHITTTDTIGNALRLLLDHPDQWELLCRRPELVPNAVEEALRYEAPVPTLFRRATRPATVAGVEIPAGADVLLVFASANRDEERYPDAARFDATRAPSRHFGFGAGVHTCVGAALARAQARVALQVLTERLPTLRRPDHPIRLRPSINVRGPLALRPRW
ncbi:cytochrome P450 [Phytohabitans sp. ZYX-F-186]|uniref:Cytochrome P450 n=1 Tax=Phytohabitans maris TaxID=3071409 RepID=A0ABU0ZM65_9ACTN|nr:cytochrome P450 [Phytohabitans sp. ZYX-F-186]MDQ7908129.1 cytochrome P450 [Phytohabitans sp. ZYX-F-186]